MTNLSYFAPPPPIIVDSATSGIKCNGGNASLGHPEVYYSFDGQAEIICGYCGQKFVK